MMFEKKYLKELIEMVESKHSDVFFNVFFKVVSSDAMELAGASEYEIYFNFMLLKHPNEISIRPLNWTNSGTLDVLNSHVDYISYHWYRR